MWAKQMAEDHVQQGLPFQEHRESNFLGKDSSEASVLCPRCFCSTDSLKSYDVPNIVFLLLYIVWNYERLIACPSCTRKALIKKRLLAIPLANVLFPLTGVIYLGYFIAAGSKGHSDLAVADAHRMSRDELITHVPEFVSLRKPPRKEWIVLSIIVLLCAGVWVFGFMLSPEPSLEGKTVSQWLQQLNGKEAHGPNGRLKAAQALGQIGPQAHRAIPSLRETAVFDADPWVRQEAYRALLAIDRSSVQGLPVRVPLFAP